MKIIEGRISIGGKELSWGQMTIILGVSLIGLALIASVGVGIGVWVETGAHCGLVQNGLMVPGGYEIYKGVICVNENGNPFFQFGWVTDNGGKLLRFSIPN